MFLSSLILREEKGAVKRSSPTIVLFTFILFHRLTASLLLLCLAKTFQSTKTSPKTDKFFNPSPPKKSAICVYWAICNLLFPPRPSPSPRENTFPQINLHFLRPSRLTRLPSATKPGFSFQIPLMRLTTSTYLQMSKRNLKIALFLHHFCLTFREFSLSHEFFSQTIRLKTL